MITDFIFLSTLTIVETRRNVSAAVGFKLALSGGFIRDVAYQYDILPEIRNDFGAAQTLGVSPMVGC
jgi:hypothetical protein